MKKVLVSSIPKCDFCETPARFDTQLMGGHWACVCDKHMAQWGTGSLGSEYVLKAKTVKQSLSYDDWVKALDVWLDKKTGLTHDIMCDAPLKDWYEDNTSPSRAGAKLIQLEREG